MSSGTTRDLRHLGDREPARALAVELAQARERDMRDVHVEAHADRIGRDQIVDLAGLIHRNLRVARARRERAHHHRRAAAQPPQHLGDRVDLLRGEGDDHRALGQPRQLLRTGIGERREARAADDLDVRHQRAQHRPQRLGAEDQRLLAAACAQQAVGEDMAALGVGRELRLVERDEGEIAVGRHALGCAQIVARMRRQDLLLAGQQRDLRLALDRDHAVVDLACEQPERERHQARGMAAHPFDGIVGLARVRGPQHGDEPIRIHGAHPDRKVGFSGRERKRDGRAGDSVRREWRIVGRGRNERG